MTAVPAQCAKPTRSGTGTKAVASALLFRNTTASYLTKHHGTPQRAAENKAHVPEQGRHTSVLAIFVPEHHRAYTYRHFAITPRIFLRATLLLLLLGAVRGSGGAKGGSEPGVFLAVGRRGKGGG